MNKRETYEDVAPTPVSMAYALNLYQITDKINYIIIVSRWTDSIIYANIMYKK